MNNDGKDESILSYIVIFVLIFGVIGVIIYIVKNNDNSMEFLNSLSETKAGISTESQSITTNNLTIKQYMRDKMSKKEVQMLMRVVISSNTNVGDNGEKITIRLEGEECKAEDIEGKLDDTATYKAYFANQTKSDSYSSAAFYADGAIRNIWISKIENIGENN